MRIFIAFCLLWCSYPQLKGQVAVPEKLQFADLQLTLNGAARKYIGNVIAQLKPGSSYFNALVEKANTFFPEVERAFDEIGVPHDLKYIVLQESALRGDAVSKSNAVGFWQFKEPAAREVGLVMNRQIDERRHIYRASVGAARYFLRINRDFDNWIFAIIGYNRGPYGAIPYTDERFYGKKRMVLTGNSHWYALKAIAYKLMFEGVVGKAQPQTWLEIRSTQGESSVAKLAREAGVSAEELKAYNLWMRGSSLPAGESLLYYVPRTGSAPLASLRPPKTPKPPRQIGSTTEPPPPRPKAIVKQRSRRFFYLDPLQDPDYAIDYVHVREGQKLVEIAVAFNLKVKKLREWNQLGLAHRVQAGEIVYLRSPKKVKFHIVGPGETLKQIAAQHETTVEKLRHKNRMPHNKVYAGQKLYLKSRKPKKEKPILLENPWADPSVAPAPTKAPVKMTVPKTSPSKPAPAPRSPKRATTKAKYHTVRSGETLWRISQNHSVTVDALKKANGLRDNTISVGQRLRIPARKAQ
ncbi:MAG: LysM peptidoglycan-binding domain-containing protein [Bacteroidota bacterium]